MLALGSLSFAAPWVLLGLLALPLLWFFLRLMPPAPRRVVFPPVRILMALVRRDETSATTPPWLIALRFTLAAAAVAGLAHPVLNAESRLKGEGPLVLAIDDGWAAAGRWPERTAAARRLIERAEREGRAVVLAPTARAGDRSGDQSLTLLSAVAARRAVESLKPKPWPTDRAAVAESLAAWARDNRVASPPVAWLSDGLETGEGEAAAFAGRLRALGPLAVAATPAERLPLMLRPPRGEADALVLSAERATGAGRREIVVIAYGDDGRALARERLVFADGRTSAEARMTLPPELRNRLARVEIEGEIGAAAVALIDERWRRRPVGIAASQAARDEQPLLGELYYLERALDPWAETRRAPLADLLARPLAVLALVDPPPLAEADSAHLARWIEAGGVAVRFAGPRLAAAAREGAGTRRDDPFLPVRLRAGDRTVGGALTWERPVRLAPFDDKSPFAGLGIPDDARVRRQVLAEPELDLGERTWARLADGTPLVTAEKRGRGWLVLVHVTANAQWSDLPLSGLFVGMLQRLVALSQGLGGAAAGPPLAPHEILDGFGRLGAPGADVAAIAAESFAATRAGPRHPPGFYGAGSHGERAARRALNLADAVAALKPASPPADAEALSYGAGREADLRPWLLGLAFALALADLLASLALRGLLVPAPRAATLLLLAAIWAPVDAAAQSSPSSPPPPSARTLAAVIEPTLAYVRTGRREIDDTSRAGLEGLGVILRRRTAAEMGPPAGIDPERDELSVYPLIYWPLPPGAPVPLAAAAARIVAFMRGGGTVLFDTMAGGGGDLLTLGQLARQLGLPTLEPVGPDHVLTRAFYLLREFPGRHAGGTVWVERAGERVNDGVSPVIAGGGDWAAAWAMDDLQRPLFPVVPGGERQREYAYRFGVNVVMYVLTGNYKSDQVHVPAIMQRLGR